MSRSDRTMNAAGWLAIALLVGLPFVVGFLAGFATRAALS